MTNDCMLTTHDNPYNPFTQFEHWFLFDVEKGYDSCGYLARIAKIADGMSEAEQNEEIEHAIDEIISLDIFGVYEKVYRKQSVPA